MTDINTNPDPSLQPDPVFEEPQKPVERPKRKRSKIMLAGALGLVGLVAWSLLSDGGSSTTSSVVPPPSLNTTVGGEVQQTSAEYAQSLRQANDTNASAALEQGRTFIPTPEGALNPIDQTVESLPEPVVSEVEPEPEPAAVVERKRPVVPQLRKVSESDSAAQQPQGQQGGQKPEENPFIGLIGAQMGQISNVFAPRQSGSEMLEVSSEPRGGAAAAEAEAVRTAQTGQPTSETELLDPYVGPENAESESENPSNARLAALDAQAADAAAQAAEEPEREDSKVYIAAGDMLYGEVLATVNSDAQMPVIVEVTTGEHRGARLRGTFSVDQSSGKMVVSFSQMTKGDVTVPVSALAVDGFTADSSVRSGIERRYLKRFGTVFATTFIEGLADGLAEPEKTVLTDANGNNQVVEEQRTEEEAIWNGVSTSIQAINSDVLASKPTGPKIFLHSGYPVGILFVDDLRENPAGDKATP